MIRSQFLSEFDLVFKCTIKEYFRPILNFYNLIVAGKSSDRSEMVEKKLERIIISLNGISKRLESVERLVQIANENESKFYPKLKASDLSKIKKKDLYQYADTIAKSKFHIFVSGINLESTLKEYANDKEMSVVSVFNMNDQMENNLIKHLYRLLTSEDCPQHIKMLLMNFFVLYGKGERSAAMEILKWASESFAYLKKEIIASQNGDF